MAESKFIAFVTPSGRRALVPADRAEAFERGGWKRAAAPKRPAKAKKEDADAPTKDASED